MEFLVDKKVRGVVAESGEDVVEMFSVICDNQRVELYGMSEQKCGTK